MQVKGAGLATDKKKVRLTSKAVTDSHDDGLSKVCCSRLQWKSVTKVPCCHTVTMGNIQAGNLKSPKPDSWP